MGGTKRCRGSSPDVEDPGEEAEADPSPPAKTALRRSERVRLKSEAAAAEAAAAAAAQEEHTPEPEAEPAPAPEQPATPQPPKEKKPWNRRICQSYAMERYGLARWELDGLKDVVLKPNPHYKRAAPMRLYLQREVKAIYEKKQARLQYEADHAEEFAAAKEEAARLRREAAKQVARAKVEPLKRPAAGECVPAGNTPLPQELWAVVFQRLASSLEPQGGVRGPGVVAEDMVRAGLTCRDMFIASRAGLEALAEEVEAKGHVDMQAQPLLTLVEAGAGAGVDWARWDKLLRAPLSCKVPELKAACREVNKMVGGTKAELVVRLLGFFGLPDGGRCPVPLRLWVALRQERTWSPYGNGLNGPRPMCHAPITAALRELSEVGQAAATNALSCSCLLPFRRLLCRAYGDTEGLMAAHRACLPRLGEVRAERARRAAEERQRQAEQHRRQMEAFRQAVVERRQKEAERRQQLQAAGPGREEEVTSEHRLAVRLPRRAVRLPRRAVRLPFPGQQPRCPCGNTASSSCCLLLCGHCCRQEADKPEPCPRHG